MNKMKWTEFIKSSERTLNSKELADNLIHGAIGLATEVGELKDAFEDVNRREEIGDLLWYCAIFERELHLGLTPTTTAITGGYFHTLELLDSLSKEILDQCKKVKFYDSPVANMKTFLIEDFFFTLYNLANKMEVDIEEIMYTNQKKLLQRYPTKFSSTDAIVRDLKKERAILVKGDAID
jgi:NTP pyrophosphatase (non-canonical NTP hydrolase)